MKYPVCDLWLHLVKKYRTTQPFTKFSKEYSLDYKKVRKYGNNTFKNLDEQFIQKLCEIFNCSYEEMVTDNKEAYYRWRKRASGSFPLGEGVYFIKNDDGLVKIGRTSDMMMRFQTLKQDPRGHGIKLVHFIETKDPKVLEKTLHRAFMDKRVSGEWFMLSDQDLTNLKSNLKRG